MTSDQLRAFLAVVERKNLTRAARALRMSQPGLTRQLQSLERELGARLLVRTPRGVKPTEAGERFSAYARRALDDLRAGKAALDALRDEPRGAVAVGAIFTVGAALMPQAVKQIRARYPEVRLTLLHGEADALERELASGALDLAVLTLPMKHLDLVAQRLWQEDLVVAAPKGHPLGKLKRPVELGELAGVPLLSTRAGAAKRAVEVAFEARGERPEFVVETDSSEALARLVEQGVGVAVVPGVMAGPERRFDVLSIAPPGLKRQIALAHRGEPYLTAAARAVREVLVASLRKG
ncbi:MAG TPA: LysR substrate-binding domain-containing protein [Myxococcaceae bacterium]|nr:LysR substrate-binding domain-containing protein [Myxococcaceae bacterium]